MMKAIVVRQPWATLIALGVKTIETRPAPPNGQMRPAGVRGLPGLPLERGERIAIVAGAATPDISWEGGGYAIASEWVQGQRTDFLYREILSDRHDLPLGAVVCTVTVDDALPIRSVSVGDAPELVDGGHGMRIVRPLSYCAHGWSIDHSVADQLPLGDFSVTKPPRWGWVLSNPQPPTKPCGLHGSLTFVPGHECRRCGQTGRVPADPIPCKGRQGVFALPDDIAAQLGEA